MNSNPNTEKIKIGKYFIGGGSPIMVQSMVATRTLDKEATLEQINNLWEAGAGLVRVAIDSQKEVEALKWIRKYTQANLSVDLQENFLIAKDLAPIVQKIRYNPGHLHHLKPSMSIEKKVQWIIEQAKKYNCAIRIGVNSGSIAPDFLANFDSKEEAIIQSALYHCDLMKKYNFKNFCVSLKSSSPQEVIKINQKFAKIRPNINIHLGVTEAGMPPQGVIKTRYAFEKLLPQGIGSTIRVSLTLPFAEKAEEIRIGNKIIQDIQEGKFWNQELNKDGINIISCPSCSRVENEKFIELAQKVQEITDKLPQNKALSIAVMGCRVNGPGETDNADLGLWCGPKTINLKKKTHIIGNFSYKKILTELQKQIKIFYNDC